MINAHPIKFIACLTGDRNTKICDASRVECYERIENLVSTYDRIYYLRDKCMCLPACTTIEYIATTDRIEFNMTAVRNIRKDQKIDNGYATLIFFVFNGKNKFKYDFLFFQIATCKSIHLLRRSRSTDRETDGSLYNDRSDVILWRFVSF